MPTYAYTCPACGRTTEEFRSISERHQPAPCSCGGRAEFDLVATLKTVRTQLAKCWPRSSASVGVLPEQIPTAREAALRAGIPTEFTRDGEPVFTGPDHCRRFCRAFHPDSDKLKEHIHA